MQDLDIRGAGNMLGAEQSGFIAEIGFETYHRILDEALLELKENEYQDLFREAEKEDKADKERNKRQDKRDEEQKEERDYSRGLIKDELGKLHHDSMENAKLNKKSIGLQKSFGNKTISALNDLCNKINGKSVIKP